MQELSTPVLATGPVPEAGAAKTLAVLAKTRRNSLVHDVPLRGGDHRRGDRCHAHVSSEQVVAGRTRKHEESSQDTTSECSNSSRGRSLTAVHHLTRTPMGLGHTRTSGVAPGSTAANPVSALSPPSTRTHDWGERALP